MATLPMTQDMEGVEDTKLERSFSALESNCENTVEIKKIKKREKNTEEEYARRTILCLLTLMSPT